MLDQLIQQWDDILLHLKEEHELLDVSFRTWLLPLKVYSVEGSVVTILTPDANMITYIRKKYGLLLQVTIEEMTGFACTVEFTTEEALKDKDSSKAEKQLIQNIAADISPANPPSSQIRHKSP